MAKTRTKQKKHWDYWSHLTLLTLLVGLRVVNMLLGQLGPERCDLMLQRGNLVVVFLLHSRHTSFYLADILPYIDLVAHDFAHAASASAMAGHAARLRAASRGCHGLMLEHAWAVAFAALRALFRGHGAKAW